MSCLTSGIQIRKGWLNSPGASVSLSVKQMRVIGTFRPASVGYPSWFVLHPGSTERFGSLMFVKLSKIFQEALQSLILTFPEAVLGNSCHLDYTQSLERMILSTIPVGTESFQPSTVELAWPSVLSEPALPCASLPPISALLDKIWFNVACSEQYFLG